MAIGIVGRKAGMTRIFTADGVSLPVTVIEVTPNRVTQIKTEQTDGYSAIQLTTGERKASRLNKAEVGHFAKANTEAGRGLWEFRADVDGYECGQEITVGIFEEGQKVDVSGISQGKGFAGTIKRHHFSSQRMTHGNSRSHRVPGSIGQNQTPGRVFKGKKMTGHMGAVKRTALNLEVVKVDAERHLLLVKGAVPGSKGGDVVVKPSVKARGYSLELQVKNGAMINLNDEVFAQEFNESLVHQVVVAYQLAGRSGTRAQKNRSDVRGGGAKPWRQKGTGRARAGSTTGPIWRSGGVTFAARPQNWVQKVNKKMYRSAIASIFSELIRQDRLIVVDSVSISEPKTKLALNLLNEWDLGNNVLIVTEVIDLNIYLATRNLPHVQALDIAGLDPVSLIQFEKVVITSDAIKNVGEWLA